MLKGRCSSTAERGRKITDRDSSSKVQGAKSSQSLARLVAAAESANQPAERGLPPDCGHFDIRIDRNGNWFYRGTPIKRSALVRLFSTVLTRDAEGTYWLRTPVERGRITVDDAPFLGVELTSGGEGASQILSLRTNVDDIVTIDADHPLRVATDAGTGEPRPYVLVRDRLEARLERPVFYELVELGREERVADTTLYGVWSMGIFFPLGRIDAP